ncbi:putative membrane protein [Bradyrhizobium sp. LB9.1b]
MKRLMTALLMTLLATSLLAVTAEARGGGGHMSGFGGGHMGAFGGGHIGFGNHGGAYRSGLPHYAMHNFGGVWPRYGRLLDDGVDCHDLYYGRPRYSWPPYCG